MKLLSLTLTILLAAASITAAQDAPTLELGAARAFVYLGANASVTGAQVKLGQVAEISGFDDELIDQLETMPLGQAPQPGESFTFNRGDIRRQLANWRIDALHVAITGEDQVTVERTGRTVTGNELTTLVDAWVADSWSGQDVRTEINYTRLPDELALSEENFTLRVLDPVVPNASGSMALSIAAMNGNHVLARFPVSVRIQAWREVAVAGSDLRRGTILNQNDIQFNEREMTSVRAQAFDNVDELIGKRLVRMVRAGDVITSNHVENPPLVERGDEVLLVVRYNGVTVGCKGKAAQKGGMGEKILVRNQYGRNLTGVVTDAHTVLVTK